MLSWFKKPETNVDMQVIQDDTVTLRYHEDIVADYQSALAEATRKASLNETRQGVLIAMRDELTAANAALDDIIAAETPTCANIGKKMARIARDARGSKPKAVA